MESQQVVSPAPVLYVGIGFFETVIGLVTPCETAGRIGKNPAKLSDAE